MRLEARSVLIFVIVAGYGGPLYSAESTLEQVVAALRQRERSHTAGRIEWTDRCYRRGFSGIDEPARAPGDDRTTAKRVFAWDGSRMSYRFEAQVFDRGLSRAVPTTYANVCGTDQGGRLLRVFNSGDHPIGRVSTSTRLASCEDVDLIPVLLWIRPLSPLCFGIDPQGCQVLPERGTIKGRECLVLERTRGVTDRWYIDPAPDHQVLRYEVLSRGEARVRIDLDYTSAEKRGLSLQGWQTRVWPGGGDQASIVTIGVVRQHRLGERPLAKEFELAFPRGTLVYDEVRGREYVIEEDGSERLVTQEEKARRSAADGLKAEPDYER